MTITCDETLVMPSGYVLMDENEMTYLEGGGSVNTDVVAWAIDVGWLMGKGLAKLCSGITAKVGSKVIGAVLQNKVLQTALGQYITSKIGIVGTVLGMTSLGGMIATTWDAWDKKLDGYVTI